MGAQQKRKKTGTDIDYQFFFSPRFATIAIVGFLGPAQTQAKTPVLL